LAPADLLAASASGPTLAVLPAWIGSAVISALGIETIALRPSVIGVVGATVVVTPFGVGMFVVASGDVAALVAGTAAFSVSDSGASGAKALSLVSAGVTTVVVVTVVGWTFTAGGFVAEVFALSASLSGAGGVKPASVDAGCGPLKMPVARFRANATVPLAVPVKARGAVPVVLPIDDCVMAALSGVLVFEESSPAFKVCAGGVTGMFFWTSIVTGTNRGSSAAVCEVFAGCGLAEAVELGFVPEATLWSADFGGAGCSAGI
jgi:hypothetical protein